MHSIALCVAAFGGSMIRSLIFLILAVSVARGDHGADRQGSPHKNDLKASQEAVPCWFLDSDEDPRSFSLTPAYDETLQKLDAQIRQRRQDLEKLAKAKDVDSYKKYESSLLLDLSLYLHQSPYQPPETIDNILRERKLFSDWNRIWLDKSEFRKLFEDRLQGQGINFSASPTDQTLRNLSLERLSLVQLALLKEFLLFNLDRISHERLGKAKTPFPFEYPKIDESTRDDLHRQELLRYCKNGLIDRDLLAKTRALIRITRAYSGRNGDPYHGLSSPLRQAFFRVPDSAREDFMKLVDSLIVTEIHRPASPERWNNLLSMIYNKLFEPTSFKAGFARALVEQSELAEVQKLRPSSQDEILSLRRGIAEALENALTAKEQDGSANEVSAAKATLAELLLTLANGSDRTKTLEKAARFGKEAAHGAKNDFGARGASAALAALHSLLDEDRKQNRDPVERQNEIRALSSLVANREEWKNTPASQWAHHALGADALRNANGDAVKHLSRVTSRDYPNFDLARYHLAKAILDEKKADSQTEAIRHLRQIEKPKQNTPSEWHAYFLAQLLLADLLNRTNDLRASRTIVDSLEKDAQFPKNLAEELQKLRPNNDLAKAMALYEKGKFKEAADFAKKKIDEIGKIVEKNFLDKKRDSQVELTLQDLKGLELRARLHAGGDTLVNANNIQSVYYPGYKSGHSPQTLPMRHDRLLGQMKSELDALKDEQKERHRSAYRLFFNAFTNRGGEPCNLQRRPHDLDDETLRFVGEGLSIVGDHTNAACLFNLVTRPRSDELKVVKARVNDALTSFKKATEEMKQGTRHDAQTQEQAYETAKRDYSQKLREVKDRQHALVRAAGEWRKASGGDTKSQAFKNAQELLEGMLMVFNDNNRGLMNQALFKDSRLEPLEYESGKAYKALVDHFGKNETERRLDQYKWGRQSLDAHQEYAQLLEDAGRKAMSEKRYDNSAGAYSNAAHVWRLALIRWGNILGLPFDQRFFDTKYRWILSQVMAGRAAEARINAEIPGAVRWSHIDEWYRNVVREILLMENRPEIWEHERERYERLLNHPDHRMLKEMYERMKSGR